MAEIHIYGANMYIDILRCSSIDEAIHFAQEELNLRGGLKQILSVSKVQCNNDSFIEIRQMNYMDYMKYMSMPVIPTNHKNDNFTSNNDNAMT